MGESLEVHACQGKTDLWCMKDKNGNWRLHEYLRALPLDMDMVGMSIHDCMNVVAKNIADSIFYSCGTVANIPPVDFTVISDTEFTYVDPLEGVMHWKHTTPTLKYDIEFVARMAAKIHRHNSNPNTKHYILVKP